MTTEEKLNDLHDHLLDPDTGLFARLADLKRTAEDTRRDFRLHVKNDDEAFIRIDKRLNKADKKRSWILGVLAALGVGGGAASWFQ
jgi:hypothetical protein